jgi:diguanylate cyclase (GGDEF)-like protein
MNTPSAKNHSPNEDQFHYSGIIPTVVILMVILGIIYLIFNDNFTHKISIDVFTLFGGMLVISYVFVRLVLILRANKISFAQLHEALDQAKQRTAELRKANQELRGEMHERLRVEKQLAHDSLHDGVTGLANRTLFMDRLEHTLAFTSRHDDFGFTVVFLDIDQFKQINESFGHSLGDQVLINVAQKLTHCLRASDTVARLSGDEFIILLEDTREPDDVAQVADRILQTLQEPIRYEGHSVSVTASLGIVTNATRYIQAEDIVQDAGIAMYQAKMDGMAHFAIFNPEMRDQAARWLKIKADLHKALDNGEFLLKYQPILGLPDEQILGFEALLRWQHPHQGMISPLDFIPLAEETGLIQSIGLWVLYQACWQLCDWQAKFPQTPSLSMSVNVSAFQIEQPDFAEQIQAVLKETGVGGDSLILEITQDMFVHASDSSIAKFRALNAMGVRFQIDRFEDGDLSLPYVQDFPVDSIKIDRSFIQSIEAGSTADDVRKIIDLAHNHHQRVIAVGIETKSQLEYVKHAHCEAGQGYLLGRPQGGKEIEDLLLSREDHETSRLAGERQAISPGEFDT